MSGFTSNPWRSTPSKYEITVTDQQTIQQVIDSIPVMQGDLVSGIINPYVVKVPPGHETDYYSLVRDASDTASDKRNVKVIFEDNPDGKFIVDGYDMCNSLSNWGGVVSLDSDYNFEGEYGFTTDSAAANPTFSKGTSSGLDVSKYQGFLIDIDCSTDEVSAITLIMYSVSDTEYDSFETSLDGSRGHFRGTVYIPFLPRTYNSSFDYADISQFRFEFARRTGFTDPITAYMDNIRLVRGCQDKKVILRFDDARADHWTVAKKLLDARGWKGCFGVTGPDSMISPAKMSIQQMKAMHANGHDIINHTIEHANFEALSPEESYFNFQCGVNFLNINGIKTVDLFINPGHTSNQYLIEHLETAGVTSMHAGYNFFPVPLYEISDPAFSITTELQAAIDIPKGGVIQILAHELTNETNFSTFLDWVEVNFSEVILASNVLEKLPSIYRRRFQNNLSSGVSKTLSADFSVYQWHGESLFIDPGGAARDIIPIGSFKPFSKISIINTADAAETLTFDPLFTSSGAHDGAANADTLTDSGEAWITDQLVGRTVNNTTDSSSGIITANDGTTITAVLSGGTDDDWDIGDTYTITPVGSNQDVEQDGMGMFIYDGEGWY